MATPDSGGRLLVGAGVGRATPKVKFGAGSGCGEWFPLREDLVEVPLCVENHLKVADSVALLTHSKSKYSRSENNRIT